MNKVNGITDQASQAIGLVLADGSRATLALYFRPQQNGWFYDLSWPGTAALPVPFVANGRRLVTSGNLLRQFRDFVPFGLAVFTPDNSDPMTQTCFVDGTAEVVLLGADDVAAVEAAVYAAP